MVLSMWKGFARYMYMQSQINRYHNTEVFYLFHNFHKRYLI